MLALLALACASPPSPDFSEGGEAMPLDPVLEREFDPTLWLEPHWEETAEICDLPDPLVAPAGWTVLPQASEDCRLAIAEDIGLDWEADDRPVAATRLLTGMVHLLAHDMGPVADAGLFEDERDPLCIHDPFLDTLDEVAEVLGHDQVGPTLYDYVASVIVEVRFDALEGDILAHIDPDRVVTVNTNKVVFETEFVPLLVHEASHPYLEASHVVCPDGTAWYNWDVSGQRLCDSDWSGPWGMGSAAGKLLSDAIPDQEDGDYTDSLRGNALYACSYAQVLVLDDDTNTANP